MSDPSRRRLRVLVGLLQSERQLPDCAADRQGGQQGRRREGPRSGHRTTWAAVPAEAGNRVDRRESVQCSVCESVKQATPASDGRFRATCRRAGFDPKKPAAIFSSIVSSGLKAAVHKTPQENGVRDQRSVARANRLRNKIAIERLHPIVAKGDCRPVAAFPCFHPPVKKQAFVE